MLEKTCSCGSSRAFAECCEPFLTRKARPATPEALMRSRFSAFKKNFPEYLLHTLHPSQRTAATLADYQQACVDTAWRSLRVIAVTGGDQSQHGVVEFVAFYGDGDTPEQLHERSNFLCEEDQWYYLDGIFLPAIKLGRNEACWCGSGLKLKKCHH